MSEKINLEQLEAEFPKLLKNKGDDDIKSMYNAVQSELKSRKYGIREIVTPIKEFSNWNHLYENIEKLDDDDLDKIHSHLEQAAKERSIELSPSNDTFETTQD